MFLFTWFTNQDWMTEFSDVVFEFTESIIWSQLTRKSLFAMDFMLNLINHISYYTSHMDYCRFIAFLFYIL